MSKKKYFYHIRNEFKNCVRLNSLAKMGLKKIWSNRIISTLLNLDNKWLREPLTRLLPLIACTNIAFMVERYMRPYKRRINTVVNHAVYSYNEPIRST